MLFTNNISLASGCQQLFEPLKYYNSLFLPIQEEGYIIPLMKIALTIAGFDPSGGAGIQADLKVFQSLGIYGLSVAAAVTAQNTRGVTDILPIDTQFIKKQLSVLLSDMRPDSLKTGMLYHEASVAAAARLIRKHSLENIVTDPVLTSSSGKKLGSRYLPDAMKKNLFPLCTVITPNIYEASVLTGLDVRTNASMERAAVQLKSFGPRCVIITGGHLKGNAMDLVYDGRFHVLKGRKLKGDYHGTGCVFSAAITALLAQGTPLLEAVRKSKLFMNRVLNKSVRPGSGMKILAM
jgi:hydroxymethylpyrimidine/phosphomethylpyrimidine kinase